MQVPFCSIIVLNYQGERIIKATLDSLLKLNYPKNKYKIIIVDNGSTDGSRKIIESFCHCDPALAGEAIPTGSPRDDKQNTNLQSLTANLQPPISSLFLPKNIGFSRGNNIGIQQAKGKYIALVNNDCIVHTDWLKELVAVAEKDEKIFAVNPKVYLGKTNKIQNAGIRIFKNGYAQDRGAIPKNKVQEYEKDRKQYDKEEEIDAVCAVATLYRKSILDKIGHFDESFFLYYEDVEISKRATKFGFKLMYAPKAIAYHQHSATSNELSSLFMYHSEKGRLLFLLYYFPLFTFLKELIIFGIKAKGRFIIRLFNQPKASLLNFQYIKAFLFILFLWPYYLGKRFALVDRIKYKK